MKKTATVVILVLTQILFSSGCCRAQSFTENQGNSLLKNHNTASFPDRFDDMSARIEKDNLPVHAIFIVCDNKLQFEKYYGGRDRETLHLTHHIINSVISCCIGICIDEGLIENTDSRVVLFFPEYIDLISDKRQYDITIRHLLTMSGGYRWESEHNNNPVKEFVEHPDIASYMFSCPLSSTPGSVFSQNSGGIYLLTRIIEKVSGKSIAEFADEKLFAPLGIRSYRWEADPVCATKGPYALYMRPADMAVYGRMILGRGKLHGKRIVSEIWLEESLQVHFRFGGGRFQAFRDLGQQGTGYCWWIFSDVIAAQGHAGQCIFIVPGQNLVAVFAAEGPIYTPAELFRDYVWVQPAANP
ncbi:MAG: serine hydrolase [Spirochaetales bacterium]|nr:serine hydrolase [Spirochaetales bacterium]